MDLISPIPQISIDAFSGDSGFTEAIRLAATDRRMARTTFNQHGGDIQAAIRLYKHQRAPHLIITELRGSEGGMIAALVELSELCEPGTRVIAAGSLNDVGAYRTLLRHGVSDYLVMPIDALGIIRSISEVFSIHRNSLQGRVIAVMGSKGGVGSSTVAHNLAWAISKDLAMSTVLIDLDLPFGTAGLAFDDPVQQGLVDALSQPDRIDTALVDRLLSGSRERLNLLGGQGDLTMMPADAEVGISALLGVVRQQVTSVVIDMPHIWSAWSQRVLIEADDVVLVSAPDIANLRNAKNMAMWLESRRTADRKPNLVLNMTGMAKRRELSMKEFTDALNLAKSRTIRHQPGIFTTAADSGQMIGETGLGTQTKATFVELAEDLMGSAPSAHSKANPIGAIMSRLRRRTSGENEAQHTAG